MLERTISMPQWTTSQNSGEAEMVFNTAKSFHVIQWLSACIQPKGDSAKYHCAWLALFCFVCLIAWTWDMMAQKTFCASARLQQLQPSRNHRIIRTLRANRVGYRSWSSLSLCFTTTIHKSKDLPPKSQDPRAIIETSQRMCIQASKSRDSVGVSSFLSIQYPSSSTSSSTSSCPAQDIKHINKHQQITGSTGKNSGNKSPHTPWNFTPGPMGIRTYHEVMKPFDWRISLPSPHFRCLDFFCGRISSKAL